MEAQSTGIRVVMNAKTALELGCPIRGIVAYTSASTDKAGRSVPAPGRGVLNIAKEVPSKHPLPLLDINYRRRHLRFAAHRLTNEQEQLREEVESAKAQGQPLDEEYIATCVSNMEKEAS
ncbi:hypothetical protein EDD18DRAFT_287138 [Armillaria luteobubalina]|uniref:Uncharacterized protein n=1 Tax=Armillaria luteobubalina TaxID=153913 RepID=A0AA39Q277_9AGAR|nr:hypothetical protein EDD18DRAFT_287138 [Armillaria luteobubalina]